jgi:hypothetical protein
MVLYFYVSTRYRWSPPSIGEVRRLHDELTLKAPGPVEKVSIDA